jgi:hypothetical protein
MKVIKRGTHISKTVYTCTCNKCKSELEAEEDEVKHYSEQGDEVKQFSTQRDGDYWTGDCVVCGKTNYFKSKVIQVPIPPAITPKISENL